MRVPSDAFLAAREEHLRSIGRDDLLSLPEPRSPGFLVDDGLSGVEYMNFLAEQEAGAQLSSKGPGVPQRAGVDPRPARLVP